MVPILTSFFFNGTGDQVITAFKYDPVNNTPSFKYSDITITGGNRNVTLGGGNTDTISITGNLMQESNSNGTASPFVAGKGFIVAGSSVDFGGTGTTIPVLKPAVAGGINYNNIIVSSGTRVIGGDMTVGGNLTVLGTDPDQPAVLTVGNGSSARLLRVLGNLTVQSQ